jgi:hypothetical protein
MLHTVWAIVRDGKIELLERVQLPEGAKALVTLFPQEEATFWLGAGRASLDSVWDNPEDDVYAQLLKA